VESGASAKSPIFDFKSCEHVRGQVYACLSNERSNLEVFEVKAHEQ
jgi:hypothetical protein